MNIKDVLDTALTPGTSVLAILDKKAGDTKITWDRTNPVEVDMARTAFDKAKASGFMAWRVEGKEGTKGVVLQTFDTTAERIILTPPLRGGRA